MIKHYKFDAHAVRSDHPEHIKTRDGKPILNWLVTDIGGMIEIEPVDADYAGSDEDMICFDTVQDAIVQLTFLINFLQEVQYSKDPKLCSKCSKPLPYEVTQTRDWKCPNCDTTNMGC